VEAKKPVLQKQMLKHNRLNANAMFIWTNEKLLQEDKQDDTDDYGDVLI
jgi:hypothetical protein